MAKGSSPLLETPAEPAGTAPIRCDGRNAMEDQDMPLQRPSNPVVSIRICPTPTHGGEHISGFSSLDMED